MCEYTVYNKSRLIEEPAEETTCPQCRGFGGIVHKGECDICHGIGRVIKSKTGSGWLHPLDDEDSILF